MKSLRSFIEIHGEIANVLINTPDAKDIATKRVSANSLKDFYEQRPDIQERLKKVGKLTKICQSVPDQFFWLPADDAPGKG